MNNELINTFTSSLNAPYKDFCEEYIRLAELIIQFDQDQMERIAQAENDEITHIYMGVRTNLSFLGEEGIKHHFKVVKARLIKEAIENNSGVKFAYGQLNRFMRTHKVESSKIGMTMQNGTFLAPLELLNNYEIAVKCAQNFKIQTDAYKKK